MVANAPKIMALHKSRIPMLASVGVAITIVVK
jgi:hypothetical protein